MNLKENALFAGRYLLLKLIGVGGFSEVWLATDQMTEDTRVAIKVFVPDKGLDEDGIHQFRKEYALTQPLNHSNLLKANYFDIFESSPYLVMPFMENGSLSKLMYKKGTFSEEEIVEIIRQIGSGMAYLHRNNIVHQDIKPDNILVDREDNYLLTDFGISSKMRNTLTRHSTSKTAMTVSYAPPERFGKYPQTTPAGDIFSFGVMMYELTTGEVPWMGAGGVVLRSDDQVPLIPETYSPALSSIIEKCMSVDPANRPTARDLADFANDYFYKKSQPPAPVKGGKKTVLLNHDAVQYDQPPSGEKRSGTRKGSETVIDNRQGQKGKIKATVAGASSKEQAYQADSQETVKSRKNRRPGLKVIIPAACLVVAAGAFVFWNFSRTKVVYYKNYVEEWGVPQGIHELTAEEVSSRNASYKFVFSKGKLREMSRVNSNGSISPHNDSEQLERPDLATFVYNRNGDLDYTEVKDRNGIVYLADYDLKGKSVSFTYNDVLRTPYYLTGRTSAFKENPFATKGKVKGSISRFNLTFDDKGRVVQVLFANPDNISTGDQDAVYGRKYLYDERGNLTQKTLIGRDGGNENNNSLISISRYKFDQEDNWISSEWIDRDNKPALCNNGFFREENTFDTFGNIVKVLHFDRKNNLCLTSDLGIAGNVLQYNSSGQCIRQEFTDIAGKLTLSKYGMAIVKYTYDESGNISRYEYFDVNDQPCLSRNGVFAIAYNYDSRGNQTEYWNYNLENKYCINTENGIAGETLTYDAGGNVVKARNFNANREPLNSEYYYAGVDLQYDLHNNILERKLIVPERLRAANPEYRDVSALIIRYKYDLRNNIIEESYHDQNGAPFLYSKDYHGSLSEYDERGNVTKVSYFGLNREPARVTVQAIYVKRQYDRKSNLIEESYYDKNDQPTYNYPGGFAGFTATYNDRNLQTSWKHFDVNRQLAGLNASVVGAVSTYDENGTLIETYYINKNQEKVDWRGNRI